VVALWFFDRVKSGNTTLGPANVALDMGWLRSDASYPTLVLELENKHRSALRETERPPSLVIAPIRSVLILKHNQRYRRLRWQTSR